MPVMLSVATPATELSTTTAQVPPAAVPGSSQVVSGSTTLPGADTVKASFVPGSTGENAVPSHFCTLTSNVWASPTGFSASPDTSTVKSYQVFWPWAPAVKAPAGTETVFTPVSSSVSVVSSTPVTASVAVPGLAG